MGKYMLGEKYYYKPVHETEMYEYLGELLEIKYEIKTYGTIYAYLTFGKKRTIFIEYIVGTFKETNKKCIFTEDEYKNRRGKTYDSNNCVSDLDFSSLSNQWHFFPTSPIVITSSFSDKISKNIGLPHSVNFVEKHKRTTLVWKISFNEFETTKSEAHDEKFDYLYGFLMAYFKRVHQGESKTQIKKYLNAIVYPMTKKEQTAFLQGIFYENCGLQFKEAKEYLEKIKVKK